MNKKFSLILIWIFLIIIFLETIFAALNVSLSDQGTNVIDKTTGNLLNPGNLKVEIYDALTGGNLIYTETFAGAIINGSWNVMLGENSSNPLELEFGKIYYKDYEINGLDLDFTNLTGDTVERQFFYSPLGDISGEDVSQSANLTITNINATNTGFFHYLGSLLNRITKLWVTDVNVSNNVDVGGNLTIGERVGIGTDNPTYLVDVQSSSASMMRFHTTAPFGNGGTAGIRMDSTSSVATWQIYHTPDDGRLNIENRGKMVMQIENNAPATSLYIDSAGEVGINTTTPQNKLNVVGDANITGTSYFTNASFNGGWENNGVSISDGDIFAQTGYFYNITSLNVTKQNLTIIDNLTIGGHLFSSGTGNNYFMGNLGIGTASPQANLDVNGTIRAIGTITPASGSGLEMHHTGGTSYLISYNRTGTAYLPLEIYANDISFGTAGSIRMFINQSSGNVGIGISNPAFNLDIHDETAVARIYSSGADSTSALKLKNDVQTWEIRTAGSDADRFTIQDATNGTVPVRIDKKTPTNTLRLTSDGYAGIGTTTPTSKLSISTDDPSATGDNYLSMLHEGIVEWTFYGTNTNERDLTIGSGATPTPVLTLGRHDTGGYVGIGTVSPEYNLHIKSSVGAETAATIEATVNTFASSLYLVGNETGQDGKVGGIIGFNNADSLGYMYFLRQDADNSGEISFGTQNAGSIGERVRIDKAGNVGIGTVSPLELLQISHTKNNTILRLTSTTADDSWVSTDEYGAVEFYSSDGSAGGAGVKAKISAIADGTNLLYGNRVGMAFSTYDGDGEATLTERMRITKAGNVGIGTASPSDRLELANLGVGDTRLIISDSQDSFKHRVEIVHDDGTGSYLALIDDSNAYKVVLRGSDGPSYFVGGNVGIGTTNPDQKLTVNGAINASGGIDSNGDGIVLKTKVIDIGDWNMDALTNGYVNHGLSDAQIRFVLVTIRDDDGVKTAIDQPYGTPPDPSGYWYTHNSTTIGLWRYVGKYYDSTYFDSTSYNRGWVMITYVA